MQKMKSKRVVVTGSGTGLGREIALEFAREGADVVFHYGRSADGAKSAVDEACQLGVRAEAFQSDFNNLDEVLRFSNEALEFLGGVDVLVNNAGISFNEPFLKVKPEQFIKLYNVNVRAQFFLTQAIVKNMLDGGGTICNLASIHGISGVPEYSVYAGTKGSIIAYSRSLAVELAHKGIRINVIVPGCVPVENYKNAIPNYSEKSMTDFARDHIPLGKYGTPLGIAKLAVFLCSDDADFIIGQIIVVDGGTTSLSSLVSDFRSESNETFGKGYV